MRSPRLGLLLATGMVLALTACGTASPSGNPSQAASAPASVGSSGASSAGAPSVGASPAFTTGPTGTPIGTWSLTLVGGPAAGEYQGSDEMICTGLADAPRSVIFQPVGSPPIQQIDASTVDDESSILVSAGGLESGALYQARDGVLNQTVVLQEASIDDGILTFSIYGTQQYPGEEVRREMSLTAVCPLFPADTDG